jgi:flavin reductase (DIM6/NTAB) family NADH-FMN oxidoreductase RutF
MDAGTFKDVMANWVSGVSVITTVFDGQQYGITVSSFASVSVDPPAVSINIGHRTSIRTPLAQQGVFVVNILAADQLVLGQRFAGAVPMEERFGGLALQVTDDGCPILPDTLGWLHCRTVQRVALRSDDVFVAEVIAGKVGSGTAPLAYHNRTWGIFQALPLPKRPDE